MLVKQVMPICYWLIEWQPRELWLRERGTNIWAQKHTGFNLAYANINVCCEPPAACTPRGPIKAARKFARSSIRGTIPNQFQMNRYTEDEMAHARRIICCIGLAWCPQNVNLWTPQPPKVGHTFIGNLRVLPVLRSLFHCLWVSSSELQSSSELGSST